MRSRNERWKEYLERLHERGGAIELAIRPTDESADTEHGPDVVWRVRVVACTPAALIVEPPAAFGRTLQIDVGTELIGALTVGQNRWMFHTRVTGQRLSDGRDALLVIEMPQNVERCSRRSHHRISTATLALPVVKCWPLINPASVVPAETASRVRIEAAIAGRTSVSQTDDTPAEDLAMPEVGSPFEAALLNLSGGGLGLRVEPGDAAALAQRPHLWLHVDLGPTVPGAIALTGRVAHSHIDSTQAIYAGIAFEFGHHPSHRDFVTSMFQRYVTRVQMLASPDAASA